MMTLTSAFGVVCALASAAVEIGRRIRIPAGLRQRDGGDEQDGQDRQQASPAFAPQGVGARIASAIPRPPEGAGTESSLDAAAMS